MQQPPLPDGPRCGRLTDPTVASGYSSHPHSSYTNGPTQEKSYLANDWLSSQNNVSYMEQEDEDDFEVVYNVDNFQNHDTDRTTAQYTIVPNLQKLLTSDIGSYSSASMDFFPHIGKDPKEWLRQVSNQMKSLEDMASQDPFQHISKEPTTWLQSRQRHTRPRASTCMSSKDSFQHISKEPATWLLHSRLHSSRSLDTEHASGPTIDSFHHVSADTQGWLTQKNRKDDIARNIRQYPNETWLLQNGSPPKEVHGLPVPFTLPSLSTSASSSATWLKQPTRPAINRGDTQLPTEDNNLSRWLSSSHTPWLANRFSNMSVSNAYDREGDSGHSVNSSLQVFTNNFSFDNKNLTDDWLMKTSQKRQGKCETISTSCRAASMYDSERWLLRPSSDK